MVAGKIGGSDQILVSGGFADIRTGKYMGRLVAVKTLRVPLQNDFSQIRKVGVDSAIFTDLGMD